MGWDAPWHWVVLAIIVIALFGYKKLPDAARSMGRSLRIFKTEIKGMSEDDKHREAERDAAARQASAPAVEAAPPATVQDPATQPAPPAVPPAEQTVAPQHADAAVNGTTNLNKPANSGQ